MNKECQHTTKSTRKRRLLLLSDSDGRGMSSKLQDRLGDHFEVTGLVKPGAPAHEVKKSVNNLAANFTNEDCVLIIGGTNDMQNYNSLEGEIIDLASTADT